MKGNATVVFIHGLFGRAADFDVVAALLPAHVRVAAPELPIASGAGDADRVDQLVDYLERRLQAAGVERAVLVGSSLGSHVALAYALRHPTRVLGLVLTGSSGLLERGFERGVPRRPDRDWVAARIGEMFHDPGFANDVLVEDVLRVLQDRRRYSSIVRLARGAKRENLGPRLGEIVCPTLLLWGAEDRVTPPHVAFELEQKLPSSRLLFLSDCGHAPMIERPSVFAFHLSAFLNDLAAISRMEAAA